TPRAALRKLGADAVVLGECEEVLVALASTPRDRWNEVASIAHWQGDGVRVQGSPHACDVAALPPLRWEGELLTRHAHHHHRFDAKAFGPAAEMEVSRGDRKRPLSTILDELDALLAAGITYVYFIDEIFLPDRALLEALAEREIVFGVELRIDDWSPE